MRRFLSIAAIIACVTFTASPLLAQRQMEALGRGVVAVNQGGGKVWVGWRLLATDPDDIAFNVYRKSGQGEATKINPQPLTGPTHLVDTNVKLDQPVAYVVKPVLKGAEQEASQPFTLPANAPEKPYVSIPLKTPDGYKPNDASIADLDGDGEYEIVLMQAGRARDNSQAGET
ncbi:MAG TPA: hypothetical protein VER17_21175, partial [Tepidisphaeraceae bacterium]|nr:hypothetical protein [Tepidisphaeraceae bacterium]